MAGWETGVVRHALTGLFWPVDWERKLRLFDKDTPFLEFDCISICLATNQPGFFERQSRYSPVSQRWDGRPEMCCFVRGMEVLGGK